MRGEERANYDGVQPFRNEGLPFGIANGKSQIPKYEI
jgi:hypothetical protein